MRKIAKVSDGQLEIAARLQLSVGRLVRLLRNFGTADLTPSQLSALATLSDLGPMRISEVASQEGMSASVATRIIASLEEIGYVKRVTDQEDRRAVVIDASKSGLAMVNNLRTARIMGLSEQLTSLTRNEMESLEKALPILEKIVQEGKKRG